MIRNGAFVFDARRNAGFWHWQFESEALNLLVMGILTTVLSYQFTAICYDVLLGCKAGGKSTASEIHMLMLTESSSPLEIFSAIARLDVLDRFRLRPDLPNDAFIARRDVIVSKRIVLKLLFVLLLAPLVNFVSIFISMENDEKANIGLYLGVGKSQIAFQSFTDSCDRVPTIVVGPGKVVGRFHLCFDFEANLQASVSSEQVRLTAETTFQGQVKVSAINLPSNIRYSTALQLDLKTKQELLRVKPFLSPSDAARLVHDGQDRLAVFCENANIGNSPQDGRLINFEGANLGLMKASKDFNCSLASPSDFIDVLLNMSENINVYQQGRSQVVNVEGLDSEANSLPQYRLCGVQDASVVWRRRTLNILPLFSLVLLSAVFRTLTKTKFNNDTEEAIEAIMRNRLFIGPEESLLRSTRSITYNSKSQVGLTAHYGVPRPLLPEVDRFENGPVIGIEEKSVSFRSMEDSSWEKKYDY